MQVIYLVGKQRFPCKRNDVFHSDVKATVGNGLNWLIQIWGSEAFTNEIGTSGLYFSDLHRHAGLRRIDG